METNQGVMFCCFLPLQAGKEPEILIIRELKSKPPFGERKGRLSPPAETGKVEDKDLWDINRRLISKEITSDPDLLGKIRIYSISGRIARPIPFREDFNCHVSWGRYDGEPEAILRSDRGRPDEIQIVGWKPFWEVLDQASKNGLYRVEVYPILLEISRRYQNSIKPVISAG